MPSKMFAVELVFPVNFIFRVVQQGIFSIRFDSSQKNSLHSSFISLMLWRDIPDVSETAEPR